MHVPITSPSTEQLYAISVTERTCSAISLTGTFVIIATFLYSRAFRKPINRLVFYASWGNIMANIATLVSQDGIHAGVGSSLCQFQAFLIQWFMPADALWTFAMACNVYLTFFHKYDSEQLRKLEVKYLLCCYGVPFIPAFTYFFIKTDLLGRIYGSALLWCWVSAKWDYLRIATFYGPVWLVIMLTFAIYIRAGSVIYRKRQQFRNLGNIDYSLDSETNPELSSDLVKLNGIQVTSEIAHSMPERWSLNTSDTQGQGQGQSRSRSQSLLSSSGQCQGQGQSQSQSQSHASHALAFPSYSVSIQGGQADPRCIFQGLPPPPAVRPSSSRSRPGSGYGYGSAYGAGAHSGSGSGVALLERGDAYSRRRSTSGENSSAAWAYTKYAMLFFIALLVTWVPSTVNRVYALARPNDFSFALNYTSSFVLPLQGFWNSLIYVSISWPAFKTVWRDLRSKS